MDGIRYRDEDLRGYVVRFMEHFAVPRDEAQIVADVLVEADRRGITSHGVVRLSSYYGDRLRQKLIKPAAQISVVHETETSALLDGGNGLGQVVAHRAMSLCVRKAQSANIAAVAVRNSNHFGIAGYYAMMALEHSMIGVALTNSQPLVAPTFGRSAMVGTNPIAVAVPAGRKMPFVLDMATSTVSIGRIRVYEKTSKSIPLGWAVDSSGTPTSDPGDVLAGGALLPLGGGAETSGYKGYGLAVAVDILAGLLPGASFGSHVGHPTDLGAAGVGHFFLAMQIGAFRKEEDFRADVDALVEELAQAPKGSGQARIYVAGEKEYETAAECKVRGIPLVVEVVRQLAEEGERAGVPFDLRPME
jgi:L-2-hydroxycarboxylate dehydrogenase (NAD+)